MSYVNKRSFYAVFITTKRISSAAAAAAAAAPLPPLPPLVSLVLLLILNVLFPPLASLRLLFPQGQREMEASTAKPISPPITSRTNKNEPPKKTSLC